MNRYRVFAGIAKVGQGQVLALTGDQIKPRLHALELPAGYKLDAKSDKGKPAKLADAEVVATAALEFKVGEVIGMPDLPRNLVGSVEPLDQPKSKIDEIAADVALSVRNPKGHKAKAEAKKKAAAEAKAAAKARR